MSTGGADQWQCTWLTPSNESRLLCRLLGFAEMRDWHGCKVAVAIHCLELIEHTTAIEPWHKRADSTSSSRTGTRKKRLMSFLGGACRTVPAARSFLSILFALVVSHLIGTAQLTACVHSARFSPCEVNALPASIGLSQFSRVISLCSRNAPTGCPLTCPLSLELGPFIGCLH